MIQICVEDCLRKKQMVKKNQNKNSARNSGKKLIKNTEIEIPKMEAEAAGEISISDSESDNYSKQSFVPVPSGSAGTSIKLTLKKKTRSSSRRSARSFKVVKSVSRKFMSDTSEVDEKDSKDMDDSENDSEEKPQTKASDDNIVNIEISSDESEKSFSERPRPVVPVTKEWKYKTTPLTTGVDSTTDNIPQNSSMTKKEEYKLKIKSLKNDLLKTNDEKSVIKDENNSVPKFKIQNGVEVKRPVKEPKFKVKVRSSDELCSPHKSNFINVPPPVYGQSNFSSQNGVQSPAPPFMSCDVCEIQFDSSVLLNDHKVAMKHFKCSFKDCEHLFFSSQQKCQDHQNLIHSIISAPVQQLAHQVQSLPAESSDQLLQSGVPLPPDNLVPLSDVPNIYTQTLQMPYQPIPMKRIIRPIRPYIPHVLSTRGRIVQRRSRGRSVSKNPSMGRGASMNPSMGRGASMNPSMGRGASMNPFMGRGASMSPFIEGVASMKRPASMPLTESPTIKRIPTDRNYSNNLNKTAPIATYLSQSLTKPISSASHKDRPNSATQQDVVNLFSKPELTISTVETIGNSSVTLPAGISLNSAVTIIPTSSDKIPINVPLKVANQTTSYKVSNAPRQNVDLVDLTGSESKLWSCEVCSKTYSSIELLYEHVSTLHKSHSFSFKCNLCELSYSNAGMLRQHKLENHRQETSSSNPFVIPILDITESSTVTKLQAMGVTNYVPVAQLDSQGSQYGVPIMNISRPGSVDGLKYTNFFNLGSIRKLNT